MRKEETSITKINGGMHNQKEYAKLKKMLNEQAYKQPRLYHLVLMGSEQTKEYQSAIKALCFELRRKDIPCQWKACLEVDADKGLHFHVFILAEAKYINPCSILNHNAQGWLNIMMQRRGLRYYIAPPKSSIHQTASTKKNYATLAGEKLADCLIWISYLVKARSKPKNIRQIYFGSRMAA